MMKLLFRAVAAASAVFVFGAGAHAATLSLSGGTFQAWDTGNYKADCSAGFTKCYDPSGSAASLTEDINKFTSSNPPPGLSLSAGAGIKVTFLGKEAGATNRAFQMGSNSLSTGLSAIGDSYTYFQSAGALTFSFWTDLNGGLTASNTGSPFDADLSMAFSNVSSNGRVVYAFFDDSGAGVDADFDDMVVRIEVVPVPAAAIPLLTGLGVFGFMARRRRKATA